MRRSLRQLVSRCPTAGAVAVGDGFAACGAGIERSSPAPVGQPAVRPVCGDRGCESIVHIDDLYKIAAAWAEGAVARDGPALDGRAASLPIPAGTTESRALHRPPRKRRASLKASEIAALDLVQDIVDGELRTGDQLPQEAELLSQ